MRVRLAILCVVVMVAATLPAVPGQQRSGESFKRSPVSALNASGKPQLVEFYHPT